MSDRDPIVVGTWSVLVIAALITGRVVWSLQTDHTMFTPLLGGWMLLPYLFLAYRVASPAHRATRTAALLTTLLVVVGGMVFLYAVFRDSDPQAGIAVVMTPIYQAIATTVLLPLTGRFVTQRR